MIKDGLPFCDHCKRLLQPLTEEEALNEGFCGWSNWHTAHKHYCHECSDKLWNPPCGECETHPCERGRDCWANPPLHIFPYETYYADPVKCVSFRTRRRYYDQIVAGAKREEIRADKPHWAWLLRAPPEVAVFVCGKDVHRRRIIRIYGEDPGKVLGRPLSAQGTLDVTSNPAIIVELGEVFP
jgi:hypothetical protein